MNPTQNWHTIRPAVGSDAADIATVHVASWQAAYAGILGEEVLSLLDVGKRALAWKQILEANRSQTFVVEVDAQIRGFADFGPTRDTDLDQTTVAELYAVYVHPKSWRNGIGGILINAAEETLQKQKYQTVTLWVLSKNSIGRRFYEYRGYTPDGTSKSALVLGTEVQELRYRKPLSTS